MVLRLFLVGVVACLALDLPLAGSRPITRSPIVVETLTAVPEAGPINLVAYRRFLPRTALTLLDDVKPVTPAPIVAVPVTPAPIVAAPVVSPSPETVIVPVVAEKVVVSLPAMPPAPTQTLWFPLDDSQEMVPVKTPISTATMPPPSEKAEIVAAPVIVEVPAKPEDPDAVFRHVVNTMVAGFAADLPANQTNALLVKTEPTAAPALPAEELADDLTGLYPGIAFALNREAEGLTPLPLPEPALVPARSNESVVAKVEPKPEPVAAVTEPAPELATISVVETPPTSTTTENNRTERLANAVKLTGQAVNAWAGLLSQRQSFSAMQR